MIKGQRLKQLRWDFGISAEQLAEAVGIGVAMIYRYEAEKSDPTSDVLVRIAGYFKVSTDYLVGLARDPDPPDPAAYMDYDWPPAKTDELVLLDAVRHGKFAEAIETLLEMYYEWRLTEDNEFPPPSTKNS